MTYFADDATAFFPITHHHQRLENKKEITEAFYKVINRIKKAGIKEINLDPDDLLIQKHNDTALATFHIRDNDLSRRTITLRKIDDQWFITHLHASNAPLEKP